MELKVSLMMKQIFETMKEALDDIKQELPHALGPRKEELLTQLSVLRSMSDVFIEEWLGFEEQLGHVKEVCQVSVASGLDEDSYKQLPAYDEWIDTYRRGQGYYHLLMYPQAANEFEQVMEKEPDFLLGRLYLALSYLQKGQLAESTRQLQFILAMTSHPQIKALTHNALGCILAKQHKLELAQEQFESASKADPRFSDSKFNRALCLYYREQYEEALEGCKSFLAEKENDWECIILLAHCYEKLEDLDKSLALRQMALKIGNQSLVMNDIARYYERQMEFETAVEWYEKILMDWPDDVQAVHGAGWNYWAMGDKNKGKQWIERALVLKPGDLNILFSLSWVQMTDGDWQEAEKNLRHILHIKPDHSLALATLSRVKCFYGEYDEAKEMAEHLMTKTTAASSSVGIGSYQMGYIFMETGCFEEAIPYFEEAIEQGAAVREGFFYKGFCHYMLGDLDRAEECWQRIKVGEISV